jgi:nitroreductase
MTDFSQRDPAEGVNSMISQRWSPRAFDKNIAVTDEQQQQIFDAARWAPSCFNEQPWLFVSSTAETHSKFLELLVEGNQAWAKDAPVLGFIFARNTFERNGNDNFHASFDTGAAWMAMALQAQALGLYTHGMGGIHFDKIQAALDTPEDYQPICGFALGAIGEASQLPENYAQMEQPSARKPLRDIWLQR